MKILFIFFLQLLNYSVMGNGYSYYKFSGPVSGQVYEIPVRNPHSQKHVVDYVAKPDYTYSYGVEDPQTGNIQSRQESRDGDAVSGEYSLLEADGTVRIVRYTADPINGFQATINYVAHS